ncbi:hypothetical protein NUU61_005412 [Penicillium alfredii]|uniref:MARVEL domain-containing protein n=1 Tax=Penicillium alfredii TaxID=1506179 RepID=A0A9W9F9I2_9EURO|nr:uncharacterized protein NUU61_005412 [Penicillium alfredii]KAJ5096056.1 hypothetical protein NUU61_005412 [Penicillium alfredii]
MLSWVYPLRVVQAIFALATIGVTAYVIGSLYSEWSFSNVVYFMLFNGCWTTAIAVPYLGMAPLWLPRFSHEFVIPAMEIITGGLWFSGFIAMAALIPGPGSCNFPSCHALQAQIVIAAVEWAMFAVTNYFAVLDLVNSRRGRKQENDQPVAEVNAQSGVSGQQNGQETV